MTEGPCITAALEQRVVRSGSLGDNSVWPRFGPAVAAMGVHSTLSLPLLLGRLIGVIGVYAHTRDAFDDHAAEVGALFAGPAAVAVHNAHTLAQALALTKQLQAALSTRPMVEQAIGLIRSRTGATADYALARLHAISQRERTKLDTVAQRIVDDAVNRARARHTSTRPGDPACHDERPGSTLPCVSFTMTPLRLLHRRGLRTTWPPSLRPTGCEGPAMPAAQEATTAQLVEVAEQFADIARTLAAGDHADPDQAWSTFTATAVRLVPGTEHASISRGRHGRFVTLAPTGSLATAVDAIQYDLGTGPCVDAILEDHTYRSGNIAADARWPQFGQRAFEQTGTRSMMA